MSRDPGAPSLAPLLAQARRGDGTAFNALVLPSLPRVRALCLAFTRDADDADDVLQDSLLAAHRHLESLDDAEKFEAWLCRVATNQALMWLRARRRRPTMSMHAAGEFDEDGHRRGTVPAWPVDPADLIQRQRLARLLHEIAEELPDKYRSVWVLADVQDLSMREVGEVLGLGVPAVKTRLHRARLALRARLAREVLGDLAAGEGPTGLV